MERVLLREIEKLLGGPMNDGRWGKLGAALKQLHQRFVGEERPGGSSPYLQDSASLAAYLAYFFPASHAQARRVLVEVEPIRKPVLRVLDVGSGPGPAAFAVADWAKARVDVTALDASARSLETMKTIWTSARGDLTARTWKSGDVLPPGPFDVVVASHSLNEFANAPILATQLAGMLSDDGYLVLIEPALRRTGRDLLAIRDQLTAGGYFARAPCLMSDRCPALERRQDWCHSDRPWRPPELVERAGDEAGLDRSSLKFAYAVLSRTAGPQRDASSFRIVSDPLPEKGKVRYFGCGPAGRHALIRLDRDRSDANARFDQLERGDIACVNGLVAHGDGLRIGAGENVGIHVVASELDSKAES